MWVKKDLVFCFRSKLTLCPVKASCLDRGCFPSVVPLLINTWLNAVRRRALVGGGLWGCGLDSFCPCSSPFASWGLQHEQLPPPGPLPSLGTRWPWTDPTKPWAKIDISSKVRCWLSCPSSGSVINAGVCTTAVKKQVPCLGWVLIWHNKRKQMIKSCV